MNLNMFNVISRFVYHLLNIYRTLRGWLSFLWTTYKMMLLRSDILYFKMFNNILCLNLKTVL